MELRITAPAKINLALDVTGRREDGYHLVRMVMQAVDLCDTVVLRPMSRPGLVVNCPALPLLPMRKNLAYRAAELFFDSVGPLCGGLMIEIDKRIPSEAGLAGGSTDAAAVLAGLNELYGHPVEFLRLTRLAARLGADVPFCLIGGAALAEGIGTDLTALPSMQQGTILLAKPKQGVSTAEAYAGIDSCAALRHAPVDRVVTGLYEGSLRTVAENTANVFEQVVTLGEVDRIRRRMRKDGALAACMTGTGSAVFGLFRQQSAAEKCAGALREKYEDVFVVPPRDTGCTIETRYD